LKKGVDQAARDKILAHFTLNGRYRLQLWQLNRRVVIKGHIRAKEVVVSDKEGNKGSSTVGNESDLLIWLCGANSFNHGSDGWLGVSVVCEVVSGDLKAFRGDKEEDVMMFAHNFDIGFITCADIINMSFILEVKAMAIVGSGFSIIKDSLIREVDIKD